MATQTPAQVRQFLREAFPDKDPELLDTAALCSNYNIQDACEMLTADQAPRTQQAPKRVTQRQRQQQQQRRPQQQQQQRSWQPVPTPQKVNPLQATQELSALFAGVVHDPALISSALSRHGYDVQKSSEYLFRTMSQRVQKPWEYEQEKLANVRMKQNVWLDNNSTREKKKNLLLIELCRSFPTLPELDIQNELTECADDRDAAMAQLLSKHPRAYDTTSTMKHVVALKRRAAAQQERQDHVIDEEEKAKVEVELLSIGDSSARQLQNMTLSAFSVNKGLQDIQVKADLYSKQGVVQGKHQHRLHDYKNKQFRKQQDLLTVKAAATTFKKYNNDIGCTLTVDLHGLRVKEALVMVKVSLNNIRLWNHTGSSSSRRNTVDVDFITGKGLHSVNNKSRLTPAVVELLQALSMDVHREAGKVICSVIC